VKALPDQVLDHLRQVADWPDLSSTKYELIEKIDQGGMASVYRARDRELDRPVAIKVLSDLHSDSSARTRMLEEARIISRLEHPGIVPVHDFGILPDGRIYFAMKLVRGRRLDQHTNSDTPLPDLLAIFEKVCQTVAFAHAHGVIHRDLKPQNIMVGPFGEVLVMDWGVAKQLLPFRESDLEPAGTERSDTLSLKPVESPQSPSANQPPIQLNRDNTVPGAILGTPGYMAPEQIRGDAARIDQRTDIYGLGGILYFLLTRRPPQEIVEKDLRGFPPRHWNRTIPRPLEAVCMKALAGDPGVRYSTVEGLIQDLDSFRTHRKVQAYPEGFLTPAIRFTSKYRAAIVLILAYLVVRLTLMLVF
jgi:serine/threonine protein kinase